MRTTLTIAAMLLTGVASAATLTETRGGINTPYTVTAERGGADGTGRMADTPILRDGPDGTEPWRGRFNPYSADGSGPWYGSGDNSRFTLHFDFERPTDRLSFGVTDAADIREYARGGAFEIRGNGSEPLFTLAGRQPSGDARFFTVAFDELVDTASVEFSMLRNDGIGVAIAPVPLPAAAWLLLGGIGLMGAVSWRRKAAS